jgi:mono/diheme cytochrome c family protein
MSSSILNRATLSIAGLCLWGGLLATGCSSSDKDKGTSSSIKFQQYYVQGEQLYLVHCSNCHQKNGQGLGLLYPPLNTSDYMDNHFDNVICLMRNGIQGELVVNGKSFNKAMPGISTLSDLEIAEIGTYIYNTWSHQRDSIALQDVSSVLSKCEVNR